MLRDRVRPLFYTRMRLGEFDPPAMNPYSSLDLSVVQSPEHRNLSLEAAVKSFVLLKNVRGTLPLRARDLSGQRLAVSPCKGAGRGTCWLHTHDLRCHRAAGAHPHPSALHRLWVPLLTIPGYYLGTMHQCRSLSTSTLPGETAWCHLMSLSPGHCPPLLGTVQGCCWSCLALGWWPGQGACPHCAPTLGHSCPCVLCSSLVQEGAGDAGGQCQLHGRLQQATVPAVLAGRAGEGGGGG